MNMDWMDVEEYNIGLLYIVFLIACLAIGKPKLRTLFFKDRQRTKFLSREELVLGSNSHQQPWPEDRQFLRFDYIYL